MREEKWRIYIDTLQGHPSMCQSSHASAEDMKFIYEYIPLDKFPRMLNIGAGEGLETKILYDLGYNVIGLINGKTNLEYAYNHFTNMTYVECDMHDLPFQSESFDSIYMVHTFEHLFAPYIFLLEAYCILKNYGRIWISMPSFKEIDDPTIEDVNRINYHHPNMVCHNILKQMFESTGFKIINRMRIIDHYYFGNAYLLEKQDISVLHSDIRNVISKRKEFFS